VQMSKPQQLRLTAHCLPKGMLQHGSSNAWHQGPILLFPSRKVLAATVRQSVSGVLSVPAESTLPSSFASFLVGSVWHKLHVCAKALTDYFFICSSCFSITVAAFAQESDQDRPVSRVTKCGRWEGLSKMKRSIQSGAVVGLMALLVSGSVHSQATQEKPSMDPLQALNASLEQLTARVSPAVVHIRVASYRSSADEQGRDEEKSQVFTKQRGAGSGVIVDPEGYIVTALHLVEGERRIRVELNHRVVRTAPGVQPEDYNPRSSYDAAFVGGFKEADIAVLKIEARDLPTLSFAESDNLKQGQLVAAMGSPEGLRNSLSLGVLSSVAQQIEPDDPMSYIQTDAALAPGSSGGPLVDVQGGIVGINVFSLTDKGREEGLGFAVPSGMVRFVYEQIRRYGCVPRPYVGLDVQGVTATLAAALSLPTDSGIVVAGVAPGSPAQRASLHAGDMILAFAGRRLESVPQLNWALLHKRAGQQVVLEIARKSTKMSLNLTLIGGPPDSGEGVAATEIEQNSLDKLGIVGSASKYSTMEPHSKDSSPGVLVTAKLSGNEMQPELAIGDVIRSVNGVPVNSVASLRAVLDNFKPGDAVALQVERKRRLMYVTFEMD